MLERKTLSQVSGTTGQVIVARGAGYLDSVTIQRTCGTSTLVVGPLSLTISSTAPLATNFYQCAFSGTLALTMGRADGEVVVVWSN
jgi:hypothetical protein